MAPKRRSLAIILFFVFSTTTAFTEGWNAPSAVNAFSLTANSELRWETLSAAGLETMYTLAGIVDVGAYGEISDRDLLGSDSLTTKLGASFAAYPVKQIDGAPLTLKADARLFYGFVSDPALSDLRLEQTQRGFEVGATVGRDLFWGEVFFLRLGGRVQLQSTLTITALTYTPEEEDDGEGEPTLINGIAQDAYPLSGRESRAAAGAVAGLGLRPGSRATILLGSAFLYDTELRLRFRPKLDLTLALGPQ